VGRRESKVWSILSAALALNHWSGWRIEVKSAGFPDVLLFPPVNHTGDPRTAFIELKAIPEVPVDTSHRFSLLWASPSQPITLMSLAMLGAPAGALVRYGIVDGPRHRQQTLRVWCLFRARPSPLWVQASLKKVALKGDDSDAVYPDALCIVKPGEYEETKLAVALRSWYGWPIGPKRPPMPAYDQWTVPPANADDAVTWRAVPDLFRP